MISVLCVQTFLQHDFNLVNLLRFDHTSLIKRRNTNSSETVENIKTKIIEKDEEYFSKYGDILVNALKNYPQKKKSPFVNWQRNYCIFFPFIYTNPIKNETSSALDKVVDGLDKALKLKTTKAILLILMALKLRNIILLIAGFPENKISHRKAYQLFLKISAEKIEAGILAGWDINDKASNTLEDFNTIEEVIEKLKASKQPLRKKQCFN